MRVFEKLVIATANKGKYREFVELIRNFSGENFAEEIIFAPEIAGLAVEETGESYSENAILKARAWSSITGLPCLADDSGLEVAALNGAPGLFSARIIEGSDSEKNLWLLKKLSGLENADRTARFFAAIAISVPDEYIFVSEGECRGRIADSQIGSNGFGYDPVFVPEKFELTFAELDSKIKNAISHRTDAFKKILSFYGFEI